MLCPNDSVLARRKRLNPTYCSVATRTPINYWDCNGWIGEQTLVAFSDYHGTGRGSSASTLVWRAIMAGRDWSIEGRYVEYCSCDMGCPCEAMAPPTRGYCTGAVAFQIDKGRCEGVSLDGIKVVATFFFPRAIHHGGGHMQPILENTITDEQKDAIFYILSGQDQPVGTMFQIFSVIVEKLHDPIFTKIEFDWDITKRTARIEVPELLRARSEPIRNPVTDEEHRMISVLPHGWVFHEAENAAGYAKSVGELKFDLNQNHSSLAYVAWGPNGLKYDLAGARKRFPLT
jgi:hypothetical protein